MCILTFGKILPANDGIIQKKSKITKKIAS
jgi:hypothetical protein